MQPARILAIDDNEADIELLRLALDQQEEDYELEILSDGEAALRFVQDYRKGLREPEPCIILLDLHLPRYDGMAILRALRDAPGLENIQIVMLSGTVNPLHKAEIASLGASFKRKPSTLSELAELAAEIFVICKGSHAAPSLSPG